MSKTFFAIVLLAASSAAAGSDAPTAEGAWIRATPPNASTAAAYLTIRGADEGERLVGARATVAASVEIHTTMQHDGVMQMSPLKALPVPPHGAYRYKVWAGRQRAYGARRWSSDLSVAAQAGIGNFATNVGITSEMMPNAGRIMMYTSG